MCSNAIALKYCPTLYVDVYFGRLNFAFKS